MMKFEDKIINDTVEKLINGDDYRSEIINAINAQFFDFSVKFFKDIVEAKLNSNSIDLEWYKKYFIVRYDLKTEDIAIYAGMNKKTINNIHGSATKEIVLDVSKSNFDYLTSLIDELSIDNNDKLYVQIKITYNNVSVELSLTESLLVINALATKKIAIRGGAWSSIGKKVEKPLMLKLCELCDVKKSSINSEVFKKDGNLDFDREVDFKILAKDNKWLRCEVKLMGKGNPESADAVIARNSDIFVADTLSEQNKKQLSKLDIEYLELKNHSKNDIINKFNEILKKLDVKK
ncbi:CfrBI family restriction endonuclease [Brachyspira pulli]|uniref:CfrBI family restriction endonuclease n=1 Tax=Brachyspira pulli TaxID=310721 RepID=UPI00300647EE